jgi:hypothetical protein
MNEEDEEFNRIEREASMRKVAVATTVAKREWVGLTDEERNSLLHLTVTHSAIDFAKACEAKLKEKNT